MKYFKEMIECARSRGVCFPGRGHALEQDTIFYSLVEKSNVFVISHQSEGGTVVVDGSKPVEFDAPFATFSMEMFEGPLLDMQRVKDENGQYVAVDDFIMDVYCSISHEQSPRNFITFAYVKGKDKHGAPCARVFRMDQANAGVAEIVSRINHYQHGSEAVREKFKIGTGKGKKHHVVRRIIYCKPKSARIDSVFTGRKIDYSHRFLRRGHWRDLPGKVGKDRSGDYCVNNQTWVMEAEVGDENLPLMRKTRVFETGKKDG